MVAPLCWVRRFTVVGFLVALNGRVDATCAGGSTTLSTEDCSGCEDTICAWVTRSGCETEGDCTYKCLSADKSSEKLVVLVEFGTYKSDEELAAGGYTESDLAGYPDETSDWPSVSNDDVTALGRISVSSAVTTFIASGGTAAVEYPKGKVSNIILSSNVISSATSVTSVGLMNLALKNQIDTLSAFVPTSLESLDLSNTLLSTFPAKLSTLQVLKELVLDNNYVTTVDSTNGIDSITTLSMQNNDLANFSAVFSKGSIFDVAVCITDGGSLTASATPSGATVAPSSAASDGSDTTTTTKSSSSSSSMSWIVGIVCGAFVILFAAFIFVLHRRKEHKKVDVSIASDTVGSSFDDIPMVRPSSEVSMGIPTLTNEQNENETQKWLWLAPLLSRAGSKGKPQRFMSIWNDLELLSLQLRASAIKDLKPLGSGAYATVWLVRYRNLQLLASKRLRPERRTKKHTAAFVEEIKLIANFDHPNLVRLIGAAWTVETDLQMLLEYMEGGDLRRYLADPNTPSGWTTTKFNIAIDVIEALVYLHSFQPPLVHRDLKSKNVLLSSDMEAKLSDFGTSRFRSSDKTMTGGVGTGRWLAPEVIRGDSDYGPAADIYSFGTLLTELDTNQIPYDNVRASNGKIMSDLTILHRVASGKLHPKVRSTCGKALKDLVERCLLEDPDERPTAPAIAYELRVIQQEMAGAH
ncbi:Leucine-rich repeat domain, L domain-like [Phytophthora cactorum]|nr:Leucine-rich repeat domain, L domain-like [Phytophthora cactorum]